MPTQDASAGPRQGFPWLHFYFAAKLLLHLRGDIRLRPLANLLLLGLLIPWPQRWPGRGLSARVRPALVFLAALALLWSESWLPPLRTTAAFLADPATRPSLDYVLRFLGAAVSFQVLAGLAAVAAAVAAAARWRLRLTPLLVLAAFCVAAWDISLFSRDHAQHAWSAFCQRESQRRVRFRLGASSPPDLDVVIIHVCSLSWDDLRAAGLLGHPFLSHFDTLLTRFNSASSYSNPSAIRLLRAPCGQASHGELFKPAAQGCTLMDELRRLGYRTFAASNHDGRYDHFAEVLVRDARLDAPQDVAGLPVARLNFDDSAVYDDGAVLERWLRARHASGARKAALYYNTVSLHQGTHDKPAPGKDPWKADRFARYRADALALFSELDRFFEKLRASGRSTVVLFVAEHGAALEGSRIQAQDLREIPLPQITMVPAAVKLIRPGSTPGRPALVDKPTSYLALAELLRSILEQPRSNAPSAARSPTSLPETPLASESESTRVMRLDGGFWYQAAGKGWLELPRDVVPPDWAPPVPAFALSASSGPSRDTK